MSTQRLLAMVGVFIGAVVGAGCGFDGSGLQLRACDSDTPCSVGSCVNGYCQGADAQIPDSGVDAIVDPDVALTDVSDDTGDGTQGDAAADTTDALDADACEPGLFCRDNQVVSCEDGELVVQSDCSELSACDSEAGCYCAVDSCEPLLCTPGETRCEEGSISAVEVCAADGLSFVGTDPCGAGFYCAAGECRESNCVPDVAECVDEIITVCGSDGTVASVEDCARAAAFCVEATDGAFSCEAQRCSPGTRRCGDEVSGEDRDDLFVCDARGSAEAVTSCSGQICVDGACQDEVCAPGSSVCIDDFVVGVCDNEGRGYERSDCDAGDYCDPVAGACVEQLCEPGESRCGGGNTREVCDDRGAAFGIPEPCESGTSCVGGVCTDQVCPPGLRYCDDEGRAAACAGDGTGVTTQDCPFRCEDGFCEDSVCGDGIVDDVAGETCDDSNEIACDRCAGCQSRNVLVIRDGSATTASGSWVPNESAFTIEFWLRPDEETGTIFGIGSTNGRDNVMVELNARFVVFSFRTDDGNTVRVRSAQRLPLGAWSHVVATRTARTAGTVHINGNLSGALVADLDRVSIDATDGLLWIGSDSRVNALAGRIDELRLSSSVRYGGDFAPSARLAADGSTVALWHFDEGVGLAAASETGGITTTVSSVGWGASSCFDAGSGAFECGDGSLAPWEDCDDGNLVAGDGCSPACRTESRCQIGFERPGASEGGCYFILNQGQDWETARNTCRALGVSADLATVNNVEENSFLRAALSGNFWIGYNDRDDFIGNGPFVWSAGSSGYSNWASGEPNDAGPATFTREDCTEVRGDGTWNDSRCSDSKVAICEFPF